MQISGKIIFYNAGDGTGIIMTSKKVKYRFDVADWDDYDVLPGPGMEVAFSPEGDSATMITKLLNAEDVGAVIKEEDGLRPYDPEAPIPTIIRLRMGPEEAIRDYFDKIEKEIQERTQYKAAPGRIDFLRIRRFLFTTYNNLTELDIHFITPELKAMRDDLLQMSQVYDDYKSKATYPDIAFDKVFLSRQPDYVHLREDSEYSFKELKKLHSAEQRYSEALEVKEEMMGRTLRASPQYERLEEEFRATKKNYVDTIHMIASLDERYRTASRLMKEFEKEHQHTFFEVFMEASRQYRSQILYILDAQAYMFDKILWQQAQKSKVIKHFFEEAHIKGDYCAKTYLRYYLNTLDPELLSTEQQELFDLYDYLESLERDAILILVHDIDDALRLKFLVSKIDPGVVVEAFVDERKALAWTQAKEPEIVIIEDQLQSFSYTQFMKAFKKKVSLHPIIILLSNLDPKSFDAKEIEMVMRKNFSDKEMSAAIRELLESEEDG